MHTCQSTKAPKTCTMLQSSGRLHRFLMALSKRLKSAWVASLDKAITRIAMLQLPSRLAVRTCTAC